MQSAREHDVPQRLDPIPTIRGPPHPLADPSERVSFLVTGPLVHPPRQGVDWNKVLDAALFLTLLALGVLVLYFREELKLGVFGEIFVNAGVAPLILCSWALLLGSSVFRRQNLLKALSAAVIFSAGYGIMNYEGEAEVDWQHVLSIFAPAFLELGVVFLISKFFFMAEDAELQVERLEEELVAVRRSPGVGLAMSYYYNFLLPTCANLVAAVTGSTIVVNNAQLILTEGRRFFVFIPRTLDENTDIRAQLRDMQASGAVAQGKPTEHSKTHRPMFIFLLQSDVATKTCGFGFDIPTVVSSCWDRARQEGSEEARQRVPDEIVDFQNELQRLVSSSEATRDKVALVSTPPHCEAAALLHIARKLEEK